MQTRLPILAPLLRDAGSLAPSPGSPSGSLSRWREREPFPQTERDDLAACRTALRNGSKTFLAASMLLPRRVREPASALYAFCRLADDAVDVVDVVDVVDADVAIAATDSPDTPRARHGAVARLRERLAQAYAGTAQPHPADRALAAVVAHHGIPQALFDALLEGFEWEMQGRRYDTRSNCTTTPPAWPARSAR